MVLNDIDIHELCQPGHGTPPMVTPYDRTNLQPASLDVCLGKTFLSFKTSRHSIDPLLPETSEMEETVIRDHADGSVDSCFRLLPGEVVLGHTVEEVQMPDDVVARIEGKSSLARLGLIVHLTAGFIDPGFHGSVTLEMENRRKLPMILRPGMLIAQLSFHQMTDAAQTPYNGRYQGDSTVQASRYGQ